MEPPLTIAFPRGSEWRKWDLHVHSPLSILNNQFPTLASGEPDWEPYLSALEALDVAVIGVTDYFTIDGYKALLEWQKKGRLHGVTLLPNIELRLDKIVASKKDGAQPRRLNFHVIFSNEVKPHDIEDHFLRELYFNYQGTPQDKNDQRKLKKDNLEELGTKLIAEHSQFKGTPPLQVGATNAVVNLDRVISLLTESNRFKDKYLLILADEHSSLLPWDSQDHQTRKLLLQQSDMLLGSNPNLVRWCLGEDPYEGGIEAFVKEFRTLKPCIHGSDAHATDQIGRPCARRAAVGHVCSNVPTDCDLRHCWIKADPTFEGLKQLLYEPADRVRIQTTDPTPSKSAFCLASVSIDHGTINAELALTTTTLQLNPGLVAVTGGKGSGKTALVDLVAHCFMDRQHTSEKNSFVRRVAEDGAQIGITLAFANGTAFSKKLSDGHQFEDGDIVYIAQGELERYIDENSDLNRYIHSLIFNSSPVRDTVDAFEYGSLADKASSLQADLDAKNAVIDQLERSTSLEAVALLEKNGKQAKGELDDITKRIAAAEAKLSKEKIKVTQDKQQIVTTLKTQRDTLVKVRDLINETLRSIDTELARLSSVVTQLNQLLASVEIAGGLTVPSYPDREKLLSVRSEVEIRVKAVVSEIEKNENEIKNLAAEMRDHAKLLSKKQEIDSKHKDLQAQWQHLQKQRGRLETERKERSELLRLLLNTVIEQRKQYSKIIGTFGAAKDQVLSDLDFTAEMSVDTSGLLDAAHDVVDNRQVEVKGSGVTPSACETLLSRIKAVAVGDDAMVDAAVSETDLLATALAAKLKKSKSIGLIDLYRILYRSYIRVQPKALYKKTPLELLSLGQKATVLIKIYLAEGDKPIIIDSHDDHLDNEFIMDELVGAIRQARNYRQVIIASNNGNVVINSDADQIIVANRKDGVITYLAGAIEEPIIRDRALKVLEGGFDAFKRRQEKYRIKTF